MQIHGTVSEAAQRIKRDFIRDRWGRCSGGALLSGYIQSRVGYIFHSFLNGARLFDNLFECHKIVKI
jgi:hypothetical protein